MKSIVKYVFAATVSVALAACGGGGGEGGPDRATVILFGDSLTDNNGRFVTPSVHWTHTIRSAVPHAHFVASAVGGETTAQALARLPSVLAAHRPTHVVLTHGTNDFWRGCSRCADSTQSNLEQMAALVRNAGATPIIVDFTFQRSGPAVAARYRAIMQSAAHNSGSRYVHGTANIPVDQVHYHTDLVHFRDAAQPPIRDAVASQLR